MLEREALLNVALDQQLVSLLVQCVTEFAEGRFTNLGCSLPSLLDWAWARVTEIKASNDSLSELMYTLMNMTFNVILTVISDLVNPTTFHVPPCLLASN